MEFQAIIYNLCGSAENLGTFGPRITIQSDSGLPTCSIDAVKVSNYSVVLGEPFRVEFNIFSKTPNLQPVVELTDRNQVITFPARLIGTNSSNSQQIFEAILQYTQARQFEYGAIAKPEVHNMCNATGEIEVIGSRGYVTSMAKLVPISNGGECRNGSQPVYSLNYLGINEKLICMNYPAKSNRYSWQTESEFIAAHAEQVAADKALAEKEAAKNAEAKAQADKLAAIKAEEERAAAEKAAAEKAAALRKKTSITCVNGKLTKKITALHPTCPAKYKKK